MTQKSRIEKLDQVLEEFIKSSEIDIKATEDERKEFHRGKKYGLEMIKDLIDDEEEMHELYRNVSDNVLQDGTEIRVKENDERAKVSKGQINSDGTKEYIADHIDGDWSCWLEEDEFEVIE